MIFDPDLGRPAPHVIEASGRVVGPCSPTNDLRVEIEQAPSWLQEEHVVLADLGCGTDARSEHTFSIRGWIDESAPSGETGTLRVAATRAGAGGHGSVSIVVPFHADIAVRVDPWTKEGSEILMRVHAKSVANDPLELHARLSFGRAGVVTPPPASLDPGPQEATLVFRWDGKSSPPLGASVSWWTIRADGTEGPNGLTRTPHAYASFLTIDHARGEAPGWTTAVLAVTVLACLATVVVATNRWSGPTASPPFSVPVPRTPGTLLGRAFAFVAAPVPEGPRSYRTGAWCLKALCWIAAGLASLAIVLANVLLAEIARGGLDVFMLTMALGGAVAVGGGAIGLLLAGNFAYFGWVARRRYARGATAVAGAGGACGAAFMVAVVLPSAEDATGALLGIAFVPVIGIGVLATVAALHPATAAYFAAPGARAEEGA